MTSDRSMPSYRFITRRKQLIVKHTVLGLTLLSVSSGAWFYLRPGARPSAPGEPVEGITSELARAIPAGYPRVQFIDATGGRRDPVSAFPGQKNNTAS